MIADMVRVMASVAAWAAGTAVAVVVTWFGANVVVRNAGVGPGMPVINAAVLPVSSASASVTAPVAAPGASPAGAVPVATASAPTTSSPAAGTASTASGAPGGSQSASPAGTVRAYTLAGGSVTLDVTATSVQLVTAVPGAGYAVQTWSGTDWLRVDFTAGSKVSSLIASWYQHAPSVTVTN